MELDCLSYQVAYRDVKYPRAEFGTGQLLLVLPLGANAATVLQRHRKWVAEKVEFVRECLKDSAKKKLAQRSAVEFRKLVLCQVEQASEELGVKVNKVFFRKMKTKWASCSTKKNLTVNKLMKYLPDHLVEYVIFHETAHLKQKRHNEEFWKIVSFRFENHNELEKELFTYWFVLQNKKLASRRQTLCIARPLIKD